MQYCFPSLTDRKLKLTAENPLCMHAAYLWCANSPNKLTRDLYKYTVSTSTL